MFVVLHQGNIVRTDASQFDALAIHVTGDIRMFQIAYAFVLAQQAEFLQVGLYLGQLEGDVLVPHPVPGLEYLAKTALAQQVVVGVVIEAVGEFGGCHEVVFYGMRKTKIFT